MPWRRAGSRLVSVCAGHDDRCVKDTGVSVTGFRKCGCSRQGPTSRFGVPVATAHPGPSKAARGSDQVIYLKQRLVRRISGFVGESGKKNRPQDGTLGRGGFEVTLKHEKLAIKFSLSSTLYGIQENKLY